MRPDEAFVAFRGRFIEDAAELPGHLAKVSLDVEELWFAFDHAGARDAPIADVLLAEADLGEGERAFLTSLRQSSMRLYEVVDAVPGVSLTLRDAIEGGQVTVTERQGSRVLGQHEYVAARVVPRGRSGGPEMEGLHAVSLTDMPTVALRSR